MTDEHSDRKAEILKRADPEGTVAHGIQFLELLSSPIGEALQDLAGLDASAIGASGLLSEFHDLLDSAARSLDLAEHGWAYSSQSPHDAFAAAAKLAAAGRPDEEVDRVLVAAFDANRLKYMANVLEGLARHDEELTAILKARAGFVRSASRHHLAGDYDASIPMLLAQIEGLVLDFTGGQYFFSRGSRAVSGRDEATLAGMATLDRVRHLFSRDVPRTVLRSDLPSRHGILHGRDLGYATVENSARCFALLAAATDFVQPLASAMVVARREERDARYAGSDAVDASGRREDRRGFRETRELLRAIDGAQRLAAIQGGFTTNPSIKRRTDRVVRVELEEGGWWACAQSDAGWVFGMAGRGSDNWYFDGPTPPRGGPWSASGWTSDRDDDERPNWEGEDW